MCSVSQEILLSPFSNGRRSASSLVICNSSQISKILHETGELNDLELLGFALHIFLGSQRWWKVIKAKGDESRVKKVLFLAASFNTGLFVCT